MLFFDMAKNRKVYEEKNVIKMTEIFDYKDTVDVEDTVWYKEQKEKCKKCNGCDCDKEKDNIKKDINRFMNDKTFFVDRDNLPTY